MSFFSQCCWLLEFTVCMLASAICTCIQGNTFKYGLSQLDLDMSCRVVARHKGDTCLNAYLCLWVFLVNTQVPWITG